MKADEKMAWHRESNKRVRADWEPACRGHDKWCDCMRRLPFSIGLIFLCLSMFIAPACTTNSTQNADLTIANARLYVEPEEPPIGPVNIAIRDGKVIAIYSGIPAERNSIIDAKGHTVTAGLWNSHVHLTAPLSTSTNASTNTSTNTNAQIVSDMLLKYGFTSVVDTGSVLSATLALAENIELGELPGPTIFTASGSIVFKDGTPSYLPNIKLPELEHPEEADGLVAFLLDSGADGIKIFSGSFQSQRDTIHLPPKVILAIADAAHSRGSFVYSHPTDRVGLANAVENGVDVLAHTAPPAGPLGYALIAKMKENNVALIPTLKLWAYELQRAGVAEKEALAYQNRGVAQLAEYVAADGEILFGTDVGYMQDFDTAEEFALMGKAGMSFDEILASLTTNPSSRFSDQTGRLVVGAPADIVIFKDDPALDVTAFSRVAYTIKSGRVVYQSD